MTFYLHELGQRCRAIIFWLRGQISERMAAFVCTRLVRISGSLEQAPGKQNEEDVPAAWPPGLLETAPGNLARGSHVPSASKVGSFPSVPATVQTLRRNSFSPPHKITFKGAVTNSSCPERQYECAGVPAQSLGIS